MNGQGDSPDKPEKCLCHVREDNQVPETAFTAVSWSTFRKAALHNQDEIAHQMAGRWDDGPFGFYHRKCYGTYTRIRNLSRDTTKRKLGSNDAENLAPLSKSIRTNGSTLCILCEKVKYAKGAKRSKEPLSLHASNNLMDIAATKGDETLLTKLRLTTEVNYHRSCYRKYCSCRNPNETDDHEHVKDVYEKVLDMLLPEFESIFNEFNFVDFSTLFMKYTELLREEGVQSEQRKYNFKDRLEKKYGSDILFWQPKDRPRQEYVYSAEITVPYVLDHIQRISKEVRSSTECPDLQEAILEKSDHLFDTAKVVRQEILSLERKMKWPPTAEDIRGESLTPVPLYNLIAWTVCSTTSYPSEGKVNLPENLKQQVSSIAQDIVYCTGRGRMKTAKHIALPMAIKTITGSKEAVTLLNKCGHGVSYSQLEEIETTIAEMHLLKEAEGLFLPSACVPNTPAIFCWDNIDFQEETLDGKRTTHALNGIVIQTKPAGEATEMTLPVLEKSRRRTLTSDSAPLLDFTLKKRKGPTPFDKLELDTTMAHLEEPEYKDFAWLMSRSPIDTEVHESVTSDTFPPQSVPSWTAFNAASTHIDMPMSVVGYCHMIDSNPSDPQTVYNALQRSLAMADELGQRDCVVVFDQALYARAIQIIWQNKDLASRIVLRMGAFHTACTFLRVLGKRFGDAGLTDLLIESGALASGSVSGVLEGRHYNRAVRLHKVGFLKV